LAGSTVSFVQDITHPHRQLIERKRLGDELYAGI
jgi:hypothetical protein